jgi:hypothetical protein
MQFPSSMSYIYYLLLLLSISIHWHKCAKVNNERPIRDGFWDSYFTRSFTTLSPKDHIFCHGEVQHHLDGFFLTVSIHDPTRRMAVFCLKFPPFKAVRILDLRSRAPQKDISDYMSYGFQLLLSTPKILVNHHSKSEPFALNKN